MTAIRIGRLYPNASRITALLLCLAFALALPAGVARGKPVEVPTASSAPARPMRPAARRNAEPITETVTSEGGDSLEVTIALPSNPYKEPFNKRCGLYVPYLGSEYNPCGYVNFYDAGWETAEKAPKTNVEEDAEYDACGTLVSSGKTEGWHVVGTEYTLFGWHAGHEAKIPASEPPSCLGTWKLIYTFKETFSDKETLTDSIEAPFAVTALPSPADARWGGGNPSEMSCSQQCTGDPVNTATGEYSESGTDLAIPGRGPGLEMSRTYSSPAAAAGASSALGRGWAFSYGMSLSIDPETGNATVVNDNGSRTQFEARSGGVFAAPPRVLATLVENENGTYAYTLKARTIYTFDSAGKLISIADLDGDETTLAYDEAGRLQTATDGAGRSFSFSYDEAGRIKSVEDSTGRTVGYGYNEAGYLDEVTDVRGGHERFTYEGALLATREDAREHVVLTNTYDESGRVHTQTDGLEGKTTYTYSEAEATNTTEVTDPRGYVTKY